MLSDKKGRIWFGTDGVGLGLFDSGKFYLFDKANGTELRTIYSIAEDYQGNIWFSTARTGLFQYDGQNFKNYTTENNLHSMDITGLAVDGKNQLVIGYEDGFDILNTERFDHFNFALKNRRTKYQRQPERFMDRCFRACVAWFRKWHRTISGL